MKIKTVRQISLQDWNEFIEKTYGKPYNLQQQDGCKDRGVETIHTHDYLYDFENNEIPFKVNGNEMGVSFETWLNTSPEDTKKYFDSDSPWKNNLFWERKFYPNASMIANDLFKKGLLEEGEYEIKIDW